MRFLIQPQDVVIWALIGLLGGLLGGMVVRGGSMRLTDALLGIPCAILGGVVTEFVGMRETGESVAAIIVAFFSALTLTAVVRLMPGRFSA